MALLAIPNTNANPAVENQLRCNSMQKMLLQWKIGCIHLLQDLIRVLFMWGGEIRISRGR